MRTSATASAMYLYGGEFSTDSLVNPFLLDFDSGTLNLTGDDLLVGSGGLVGSDLEVVSKQTINVTNTTTVETEGLLTVNGGAFSSGNLINEGEVLLNSLSSKLGGNTLTNHGVVSGTGRISSSLLNEVSAEVRAGVGQRLVFSGPTNSNAGKIEALGGEVEFKQDLNNLSSTGLITGRDATLRFTGGLTNEGTLALSFGTSDVFGPVGNTEEGKIIISGESEATFYDDVVNNGELRVSAGSTAVYFGLVSGTGSYTGTGTNYFEGGLSPGGSPIISHFEGNVTFGAGNFLTMELGGTTMGTEYDALHVDGILTLNGELDVVLIDDFDPTLGDTFDILDWGTLSGQFTQVGLPSLLDALSWDLSAIYDTGEIRVVPEPATLGLLLIGGLALLRRKQSG